jgi:hypothetical protein
MIRLDRTPAPAGHGAPLAAGRPSPRRSLPPTPRALGWLVRDTFRQSLAGRVFWLLLGVGGLCVLLCLSVRIDGDRPLHGPEDVALTAREGRPLTGPNPRPGMLSVAFGAVRVPLFRDGAAQVHFLHMLLAKWIAGLFGTLMVVVWTAGFLPEFLQPAAASVLLAKPVSRGGLLAGKYLGVLALVAVQATALIGGGWVALGVRTGYWPAGYLLAIPLLLLNFAIVYSVSAFLATWTRAAAPCLFGSVVFWIVCLGVNTARHSAAALPHLSPSAPPYPPLFRKGIEAAYWALPKPADLVILLDRAVAAGDHFAASPAFDAVQRLHAFQPTLAALSSLLFAVAALTLASRQLATLDY